MIINGYACGCRTVLVLSEVERQPRHKGEVEDVVGTRTRHGSVDGDCSWCRLGWRQELVVADVGMVDGA